MAVPKKKTSRSRRGMRRSHDGLSLIQSVECLNCGALHLPHHLCKKCGYYNGKQVLQTKSEKTEDASE